MTSAKTWFSAMAALFAFPAISSAQTGGAQAALNACLVAKASEADKSLLVEYVAIAMLQAPETKSLATVAPGKREAVDRGMARMFTRLITVDCKREVVAAVSGNDHRAALRIAGEVLGRNAMGKLLTNRDTASALTGYVRYLNPKDFAILTPPK